jgi:cellobiose phosphorylase
MERLKSYSNRRLLGEHVPYPYEAYPEGGKAQLAAESALYCRVFTEGLFGIRPTGLHDFTVTPRLPAGWPSMALTNVHAFGGVFDLRVQRVKGGSLSIAVIPAHHPERTYVINAGETLHVTIDS